MNRKKILIVALIAIVLIAAVVWYFFFRAPKSISLDPNSALNTGGGKSSGSSGSSGTTDTQLQSDYPLQVGSTGKKVAGLQTLLNKINNDNPKLVVDGVFGNKTKDALTLAMGEGYYPVSFVKIGSIIERAGNS